MIVRNLEEARKTDRLVTAENGNWDSTRLVLANDNAGFSFHITRIFLALRHTFITKPL